ncbi:hypothetical protein NZA98_24825, partial [Escherichia coli]|nr:hypothetical protein [Escherichia coli]
MTDVALASRANPNTGSAVPAVLCGILARMSLYAWLALLVVLPNILLIGVSLLTSKNGVTNFDLTLQNFARAWESSGVWVLLWRTVATALLATAIATLIAYPMAYYAARILE